MAYVTGTASSPTNLLDSLAVALGAEGWTILAQRGESETGMTAGYAFNRELYVQSPAGSFFQFAAHDAHGLIASSAATGFNAGSKRNEQPGHSSNGENNPVSTSSFRARGWASTNVGVGPYAGYYFFITDDYCHVAIEVTVNSFRHFMSGNIVKAGPFTGGEYFTGTRWSNPYTYGSGAYSYMNNPDSEYNRAPFDLIGLSNEDHSSNLGVEYFTYSRIRLDVDGSTNRWLQLGLGGITTASGFMRSNAYSRSPEGGLANVASNTFNGLVVLSPAIIMAPRPIGGSSIYGSVMDIAPLNIANLEPKQTLTYGGDQWMVFPIVRKGSGAVSEAVSGNHGLAYKIVP